MQTEKANAILESSRHQSLLKEGYQPLHVLGESFHFLAYDDQDCCHYLEDKLCSLHREHGLTHKPVICQLYPFNLVHTPDGIFVSLLFSCPAVMAASGKPTATHRKALTELFELHQGRVPQVAMVKEHLLVTNYFTMTWAQYQGWEAQFLQSLDFDDPVASLLHCAGRALMADLDSFQESPWSKHLGVDHLPGFIHSVFEHLGGADRRGFDLPEYEHAKPQTKLERESLKRYLTNQIHGKLHLIGPSIFCRLFLLAGALSLILFDIRLRDPEVSEAERVRVAFEFYEENLISQSDEMGPWLMELEEALLSCGCRRGGFPKRH